MGNIMQSKELSQHLAQEFRYAVSKMKEVPPSKKLYYFSALYAEAQRILNLEWNSDLLFIYTMIRHAYTQINGTLMNPSSTQTFPVNWENIFEKLTEAADNLTVYIEKIDSADNKELYPILSRLAEIAYVVSGNGSYLNEKGLVEF
jgi:hypothetical protein